MPPNLSGVQDSTSRRTSGKQDSFEPASPGLRCVWVIGVTYNELVAWWVDVVVGLCDAHVVG